MKIRFTIFDQDYLKSLSAEEFDKEGGVDGYFEIRFGEHSEGEFNDFYIPEELLGGESVDYWMDSLAKALCLFQKRQTDYVAIRVIEYVNRWIEIKKIRNQVFLNVAHSKDPREEYNLLLTSQLYSPVYKDPLDTIVSYDDFYHEIVSAVKRYFDALDTLNLEFLNTRTHRYLTTFMQELGEQVKDMSSSNSGLSKNKKVKL